MRGFGGEYEVSRIARGCVPPFVLAQAFAADCVRVAGYVRKRSRRWHERPPRVPHFRVEEVVGIAARDESAIGNLSGTLVAGDQLVLELNVKIGLRGCFKFDE